MDILIVLAIIYTLSLMVIVYDLVNNDEETLQRDDVSNFLIAAGLLCPVFNTVILIVYYAKLLKRSFKNE